MRVVVVVGGVFGGGAGAGAGAGGNGAGGAGGADDDDAYGGGMVQLQICGHQSSPPKCFGRVLSRS